MTFLEGHKIIPICQSGFRKRHSTPTALINVFDDILRALDKGMMTLLILLDFSKAFDTIIHNSYPTSTRRHGNFAGVHTLLRIILSSNSAVLINIITGVSPPHFDFFVFYVLCQC
jgi:hypothetical protein